MAKNEIAPESLAATQGTADNGENINSAVRRPQSTLTAPFSNYSSEVITRNNFHNRHAKLKRLPKCHNLYQKKLNRLEEARQNEDGLGANNDCQQ